MTQYCACPKGNMNAMTTGNPAKAGKGSLQGQGGSAQGAQGLSPQDQQLLTQLLPDLPQELQQQLLSLPAQELSALLAEITGQIQNGGTTDDGTTGGMGAVPTGNGAIGGLLNGLGDGVAGGDGAVGGFLNGLGGGVAGGDSSLGGLLGSLNGGMGMAGINGATGGMGMADGLAGRTGIVDGGNFNMGGVQDITQGAAGSTGMQGVIDGNNQTNIQINQIANSLIQAGFSQQDIGFFIQFLQQNPQLLQQIQANPQILTQVLEQTIGQQQAPAQQEPAQQEPAQQEPAQQEPAQQEPAQQAPAQQAPAQQAPEPAPAPPPAKQAPAVAAKGRFHGDPHFEGADGGKYDVQGTPGRTYNLLSDQGVQVNGTFQKYGDEGGTSIGNLGITIGQDQVQINQEGDMTINGQPVGDGQHLNGAINKTGKNITVNAGEYSVAIESVNDGKGTFLNANFSSDNVGSDGVMPHGIWGQTADGDGQARNGDEGMGAQGGGAIEKLDGSIAAKGDKDTVNLYEVGGLFDTAFANFNRFAGDPTGEVAINRAANGTATEK